MSKFNDDAHIQSTRYVSLPGGQSTVFRQQFITVIFVLIVKKLSFYPKYLSSPQCNLDNICFSATRAQYEF